MFTLWLANEEQLLSPITAVAWDAGIELKQSQWQTMEEAYDFAEKAVELGLGPHSEHEYRWWNAVWVHDPYAPITFEPSYVVQGNHHTIDWWWAAIRDLNLSQAIKLAMQDPGPSSRAQIFVYWEQADILPEKWNRYDFHFPAFHGITGFSAAIEGAQSKTSFETFKHWVWWMAA